MIVSRVLFFAFAFSLLNGAGLAAESGGGYVAGRSLMERIFTGYIADHFDIPKENIRLGSFRYHPVRLRERPEEIQIEERRGRRRGKNLLLRVTFVLKNRRSRNTFISLPFKVLLSVVVSSKKLKRGDILTQNDMSARKMWSDFDDSVNLTASYFTGKELLMNLGRGEPLKKKYVATVPVVRRGDLVTVLFEKNGIMINTKGVVRGSASAGEMVKVFSNFSKKILAARVLNRDIVSVDF